MDTIGIIFAVTASITWGLVYTIDQKILANISPILWLALSSVVIGIMLLPILFFHKEEIKVILQSGRNNLLLILTSQLLIALATFLIFSSIKHLDAINASIIEITYPFFVIIFSLVLFGGSINIYFWIGSILIFIGSIVLIKFS